jgi:DNA repair protein RadC
VVKAGLRCNGAAALAFHNHPSGVSEPSADDLRLTRRLRETLALVDIRLLDHLIVGDTCLSLAERGLL